MQTKTVLTRIISIVHVKLSDPRQRHDHQPRGRVEVTSSEREGALRLWSARARPQRLMNVPGPSCRGWEGEVTFRVVGGSCRS